MDLSRRAVHRRVVHRRAARRGGFALVAVLLGLAVISVLMAAAASRNLAGALDARTERALVERAALRGAASDLILALGASEILREQPLTAQIGGEAVAIRLLDVAGLVDLNAADPALLGAVLAELGAPPGALARVEARRRAGGIVDAAQLARVAGLPEDRLGALAEVVTVRSGRAGLSPEHVPSGLREMLARRGLWDARTGALAEGLSASPTNGTYRAYAAADGRETAVGTLMLGGSRRGWKMVEVE